MDRDGLGAHDPPELVLHRRSRMTGLGASLPTGVRTGSLVLGGVEIGDDLSAPRVAAQEEEGMKSGLEVLAREAFEEGPTHAVLVDVDVERDTLRTEEPLARRTPDWAPHHSRTQAAHELVHEWRSIRQVPN